MKLLAVDPGGVHVGLALFEQAEGESLVQCVEAWEYDPEKAIDFISACMLNFLIDMLVVEEFRLYPDKAMEQTGSTMPTCELIGQIKWAHRLDCYRRRDHHPVKLVLQPASIQTPTASLLRARGIKSTAVASKAGGHAKSAELHGWYYLLEGSKHVGAPARRPRRRS